MEVWDEKKIGRLLTTSAMVWFSFFISFHPTLFCRLSVVWIDSCTGSTNKPTQPNQAGKQKIGCLVSEKVGRVRDLLFLH